jgi:hypothetical protein
MTNPAKMTAEELVRYCIEWRCIDLDARSNHGTSAQQKISVALNHLLQQAAAQAREEGFKQAREILKETQHVLSECKMAIWVAVASDDGLDGSEHDRLRKEILALKVKIRRALQPPREVDR